MLCFCPTRTKTDFADKKKKVIEWRLKSHLSGAVLSTPVVGISCRQKKGGLAECMRFVMLFFLNTCQNAKHLYDDVKSS